MRVLIDKKEGITLLRFEGGDSLEYGMADQVRQQALGAIDGAADVVVDIPRPESPLLA